MTEETPPNDAKVKPFTLAQGPRTQTTVATLDPKPQLPTVEAPPLPQKWTYSTTRKLCQWILGQRNVLPTFVRVWARPGEPVRIGMEKHGRKLILGQGRTFQEAFENVFIAPLKAKEEALEAELAAAKTPPDETTEPAGSSHS